MGTVEHYRTKLHHYRLNGSRYIEQLIEPTAETASGQGFPRILTQQEPWTWNMARSEEGPHPLTDSILFNNQIHALTLIERCVHRPKQIEETQSVMENLKLLDGLALLLDQHREGAVATSMKLTGSAFKLYWARNDNVESDSEKDYIHRILKHAQDRTEPWKILAECVLYTKERLVSKCQELAKLHRLSPENQQPTSQDFLHIANASGVLLEQEFRAMGVIDKGDSLVQHLDKFIQRIARVTTASSIEDLVAIILQAFNLCSRRRKLNIWFVDEAHHASVEHFQGFAAYLEAVRDLIRVVRNLWIKGYRTFEFEQVFSVKQPYESLLNGPAVDAINTWADHHRGLERIETFRQVDTYAFPSAERGPEGMIAIQHSQHAELTLALHFVRERMSAGRYGTFGIGVSRGSCYWCNMWLDIFNDQLKSRNKKIAVRTATGKRIDGWILPQDTLIGKPFIDRFSTQIQDFYNVMRPLSALRMEGEEGSKPSMIPEV